VALYYLSIQARFERSGFFISGVSNDKIKQHNKLALVALFLILRAGQLLSK